MKPLETITVERAGFKILLHKILAKDGTSHEWIAAFPPFVGLRIKRTFKNKEHGVYFAKGWLTALPFCSARIQARQIWKKPDEAQVEEVTFVYIIRVGHLVKIGITANMKKRMAAIKHANPKEFKVLQSVECWCREAAMSEEIRLHRYFAKNRVGGEWFDITDEAALSVQISAPTL